MTRDEIESLSGRELDAAVAEHVMGYVWSNEPPHKGQLVPANNKPNYIAGSGPLSHVKPYSTDIAAAWEVVDRVKQSGFYLDCLGFEDGEWLCVVGDDELQLAQGKGSTAPLAICRAALLAVFRDE